MPMLVYRKNYVFPKFYNSNYIILYIIIAYMNPPLIYFFKLCFFKLCSKSAPPGSSRREFQEYSLSFIFTPENFQPSRRSFPGKEQKSKGILFYGIVFYLSLAKLQGSFLTTCTMYIFANCISNNTGTKILIKKCSKLL